MTKKQQSAIQRIISRDTSRRNFDKRPGDDGFIPGGIHPSDKGYVVTDGMVAIYFPDKPEGFPDASALPRMSKLILDEWKNGNHILIEQELPVDEWKQVIRQQKNTDYPPRITITVDPLPPSDFNPRLVIDAMEAMGAGAMVYIGKTRDHPSYDTLLVYPKNWMESPDSPLALVLPYRRT